MDWLRSAASRARKFARLKSAERWLTVQIIALLVLVRVGLWILSFRRVQILLGRLAIRHSGPAKTKLSPRQLTSLVSVGADYVPRASCLTQALVAQTMLRRHGYQPILKIGVTHGGASFEAHAWVECAGEVIIGRVGT